MTEVRRPQVRATNTGISAVITPTGELLGTIGVDERGTLVRTVTPSRSTWTLMLAWGDWFGPTAGLVGLVLLAWKGLRTYAEAAEGAEVRRGGGAPPLRTSAASAASAYVLKPEIPAVFD